MSEPTRVTPSVTRDDLRVCDTIHETDRHKEPRATSSSTASTWKRWREALEDCRRLLRIQSNPELGMVVDFAEQALAALDGTAKEATNG